MAAHMPYNPAAAAAAAAAAADMAYLGAHPHLNPHYYAVTSSADGSVHMPTLPGQQPYLDALAMEQMTMEMELLVLQQQAAQHQQHLQAQQQQRYLYHQQLLHQQHQLQQQQVGCG